MDDFFRIRTFIKVVEAGSFSAAARESSSVSAVARQVASLEDELGLRLLDRSTRSMALTDHGRRFYERVRMIARDLDCATAEVKSLHDEVKGVLRVALNIAAGTTVVLPALSVLLGRYPDLELEISLTDERPDLIASQIDLALWSGVPPNADIVARRLIGSRRVVCGSPVYFGRRGTPRHPQDLLDHNCLGFGARSGTQRWVFVKDDEQREIDVHGSIRSDNATVALSAGLAALGVLIVEEQFVHNALSRGELTRVLADYSVMPRPGDTDLYILYSTSRRLSRRIRVFIDFLVETFRATGELAPRPEVLCEV